MNRTARKPRTIPERTSPPITEKLLTGEVIIVWKLPECSLPMLTDVITRLYELFIELIQTIPCKRNALYPTPPTSILEPSPRPNAARYMIGEKIL
jgi:hypothetical protein